MIRSILTAVLLGLAFVACLPEPKTGCRTTDDCSTGRVCVVGTCQSGAGDAALDANSDGQAQWDMASDLAEASRSDTADDPKTVPDSVILAPEVAQESHALVDASDDSISADVGGFEKQLTGDVATDPFMGDSVIPLDSISEAMDLRQDVPAFVPTDAPDSLDGFHLGADGQPITDLPIEHDLAPDLPIDLDLAPDLPPSWVDAALEHLDIPMADAALDGAGDLAPGVVSWEQFRAQCPREPWASGRYVVDGDLVFDEAGLHRYYDAWFSAQGVAPESLPPMGATARWLFPDSMSLSYCISTNFGDNLPIVEAAMQVASTSWSGRAGVQYHYVPEEDASCDAYNTNVTFDVRPVAGAGYAAVSFFPDSPRSGRSIFVDSSAFAVGPDGAVLEGTLRHQLGHTLGFQHEYLRLDPTCISEDRQLAVRIANYDITTVMHLPTCRPSELGGTVQTEDDLIGSVAIYGLAPALTVVIGGIGM